MVWCTQGRSRHLAQVRIVRPGFNQVFDTHRLARQEDVERGVGLRDGVVKKVCHQDASVRQAGPRPQGSHAAAGGAVPRLLKELAHALQSFVHTPGQKVGE
jgi:hypothetical protein